MDKGIVVLDPELVQELREMERKYKKIFQAKMSPAGFVLMVGSNMVQKQPIRDMGF